MSADIAPARCPFCRPAYAAVRINSSTQFRAHLVAEHSAAEVTLTSLLVAFRHPIRSVRVLWKGRAERRQWRREDRAQHR